MDDDRLGQALVDDPILGDCTQRYCESSRAYLVQCRHYSCKGQRVNAVRAPLSGEQTVPDHSMGPWWYSYCLGDRSYPGTVDVLPSTQQERGSIGSRNLHVEYAMVSRVSFY